MTAGLLVRSLLPLGGAALVFLAGRSMGAQGRPDRRDRDDRREEVAARLREGMRPRAALLALTRQPGGEVMVDVFVKGGGAEAQVAAHGGTIATRAGGWVTARVPLARLRALARAPGVRALETAVVARLLDDSSKIDIGAHLVRQRSQNDQWQGATGRGAIVGVVDTGIDFSHPDFLDDDIGLSRVLYLWDQTLTGVPPGRVGSGVFDYGIECTRDMMGRSPTCRSREVDGHGTHVAGTAAGDGSASRRGESQYLFTGVAPGADLIVVKTTFSFTSIVDGVNYIFRRAEQLGRPAVVNLSLGSQLGPHDGLEAASIMIDSLSGPGRIVVAASGNEGRNLPRPPSVVYPFLHGDTVVASTDSAELHLQVPTYRPLTGLGNDLVLVSLYYPPGEAVSIALVRPNGSRVELPFAPTVRVESADAGGGVVAYNGTHQAEGAALGEDLSFATFIAPASPMRVAELFIGEWTAGAAAPMAGTWRIVVRGGGAGGAGGAGTRVDGYVPFSTIVSDTAIGGAFTTTEVSFTRGATNRRVIGPPGDAGRAVTVAAYNTDVGSYTASNNTVQTFPGVFVEPGDLLYFSSPGPRTDNVLKPEIAAPGRVFSALSRYGRESVLDVHADSAHVIFQGTSMAAPHVTGAVALVLAERPSLTPEQVKSALTGAARSDAFTSVSRATGDPGGRPNWSWGYGKLWVPGALAAVRPSTPLATAVRAGVAAAPRTRAVRSSERGTVLPLQSLRVTASDADTLSLVQITAHVTGSDPAFRLAVVLDTDRDGEMDPSEPLIATSDAVAVDAVGRDIVLAIPRGAIPVPRGGSVDLLLVGILSGATPNGSTFTALLDAAASSAVGLRSGTIINLSGQVTGTAVARTTLLATGEQLNLTQNPVRSAPLILNFQPAQRLDIYDFNGRLVRRLLPGAGEARFEWDLRNEAGMAIANGAYVIVLELSSGVTVRRKLFVAR